eukprot:316661-Chlamydomonas_euryale.AAC.3
MGFVSLQTHACVLPVGAPTLSTPQIQTIGFLSHLKDTGVHGPFLVVAPLSTLGNWVAEFERACPSCPAVMYHGSRAARQAMRGSTFWLDGVAKVRRVRGEWDGQGWTCGQA